LKAFIFKNNKFIRGLGDDGVLCEAFFEAEKPYTFFEKLARIRLEDLLVRGRIKTLDNICTDLDLDLNLVTYMRLSTAVMHFLTPRINVPPAIPVGVKGYVLGFDRGSQGFRKIISKRTRNQIRPETLLAVTTFRGITGIQNPNIGAVKIVWGFGTLGVNRR